MFENSFITNAYNSLCLSALTENWCKCTTALYILMLWIVHNTLITYLSFSMTSSLIFFITFFDIGWGGGAKNNLKKIINWLQCHQELNKTRSTVPHYCKHFTTRNKFYSTFWWNWSISYLESRRAYQSSTVEDWNRTPTLVRNTANPHNSYIATSQNAGIGNHIGHHSSKRNRFPVHHTFAVYESIAYM